jgi:hypothetical protein
MTLAPKHSGQVSFEQPVVEGPSPLAAVAELVTGAAAGWARGRPSPTEGERKGAALKGYYERLNEIHNSDMTHSMQVEESRKVAREYIQNFGQYRTDIVDGAKAFGVEVAPTKMQGPEDALAEGFNTWIQTPEGQAALVSSTVLNEQGEVNHQASQDEALVRYMEVQGHEARLAQVTRELSTVTGDENLDIKKSERAWEQLAKGWATQSNDFTTGLITAAIAGKDEVDTPEEALAFLRQSRDAFSRRFRDQALAAGLHTSVIEERLPNVLKPFDDLTAHVNAMADDLKTMLDAHRNMRQMELDDLMNRNFGLLAADPEFLRTVYGYFGAQGLFDNDSARAALEAMIESAGSGTTRPFSLFPDVPPSTGGEASVPGNVTRPDAVADFVRKQRENEQFLPAKIKEVIAGFTTEDANQMLRSISLLNTTAEAWDGPVDGSVLKDIFSPQNVTKLQAMVAKGGEQGTNIKRQLQGFIATQSKVQLDLISEIGSFSGGAAMSVNLDVRMINGKLTVTDEQGKALPRPVNRLRGRVKAVYDVVDNLNLLREVGKQIDKEIGKTGEAAQSMSINRQDMDPGLIDDYINGEITLDDIDNVQLMSGNRHPLLGIMDRHEGGGDYDTLFGHSQKTGGQFQGVRVTEMTIGQLLQFADPSGDYGQWVASTRPDKEMGPATPMGRYQIVGTTLRRVASQMELPMNTLFTPEVQDAMFDHLARARLNASNTVEGKIRGLRQEWQGFNNVSDQKLANAIAAMEGTDPVILASIPMAGDEPGAPVVSEDATKPAPRPTGVDVATPQVAGGTVTPVQDPGGQDIPDSTVSARAKELDDRAIGELIEAKITPKVRRQLSALGIKASEVDFFNSDEEAMAALANGDLGEGDAYILPDGKLKVMQSDAG